MIRQFAPMPPPSAEFLAELTERCRRIGWLRLDYREINNLLERLHDEAGLPHPDPNPYEIVYAADGNTELGYEDGTS